MNTPNNSTPAQTQAASTPRAKETARRRVAYAHIDAAYRARRINESARELAKWYVRCCCGVWTYHNLTQAEQAARFGVARRTIVTLVQQLDKAGVIWLQRHGSANRTYITAYQAPPSDEAPSEPELAAEVREPTYDDLRAGVDSALAQGDTARAAQLTYQAAMLLARAANGGGDVFFLPPTGDREITDQVQPGSPAPDIKDSGIPRGDTESSVCHGDDDDGNQPPAAQHHDVPDTRATRLLQRYGVRDRNTIRRFAAALQDIERAERRRAALGYSSGLIPKILADGGVVWTGCGKRVDNRPSTPPLDDEDAWRDKYIGGPLAPYIIGGERNDLPVADVDDAPPDEVDEASEPERYRRDAAHAVVHGWVPPALRPMPVPPDVPPDDDPEVRTYQHYGGLPQWDEGETP